VFNVGRHIMRGVVLATVRAKPLRGDKVLVSRIELSANRTPNPDATEAEASLILAGTTLTRQRVKPEVSVDLEVGKVLDGIEQIASRTLGVATAPSSFTDGKGLELLIDLAQNGAGLHGHLKGLGIEDTVATVSLTVTTESRVVPLELAYAAPSPKAGATLCEHATQAGAPYDGPGPCPKASASVVCPYAFWGMFRTIARVIVRPEGAVAAWPSVALDLNPVLYAAANLADDGAPPGDRPSERLEEALASAVGAGSVTRVTTWAAWRRAVAKRPELLVVLGHTVMLDGQVGLEIGKGKPRLVQNAVGADVIGRTDGPPPLVLLIACSSAATRDLWGGMPAAFTGHGAAAVVAMLSKLTGPHGVEVAAKVVGALLSSVADRAALGPALMVARRELVAQGLLIGLLIVSHGEIDLELGRT
jgi:hypothetical protein